MTFSKYDVDTAIILLATLLILIVVLFAAANAIDMDDTVIRNTIAPAVYNHPEVEAP